MSTALLSLRSSLCRLLVVSSCLLGFGAAAASAAEAPLQELQSQNRDLRVQLEAQQKQLDELRTQMNRLAGIQESAGSTPAAGSSARSDRKLILSGEVGLAFFASGSDGRYPKQEFRVDDANIRLEAAVANNTFFFGELQLSKHEAADEAFHLGEFYVDFENVSGLLGGPDRLVNVRFGRFDIPFGEEYLLRDPLANPLITHSLSDVWGTDEGVELYGEFGRTSYAFAIQNGSTKTMHDYNADKALTLRVGYDVLPQLHVSASVMRTGELASALEPTSEVWFGNVVFRNISSSRSTTHQANLAEVDATYRWKTGHLWLGGGKARYTDNDPLADNTTKFTYFQAEAVQSIGRGFYAAARFSTLRTGQGYPIAGIGNLVKYFLTSLQTKELQRLSVGGGYRFNSSLVIKTDYTSESATLTTGKSRDNHLFSFETAIGF
ncbi:MAG: hypothetical protein ABIZ81_18470 [Opitutaceae bacterium]